METINLTNDLVQMDSGTIKVKRNKNTKIFSKHKGQEVGKSHNHPRLEGTQHLENEEHHIVDGFICLSC